MTEAPGPDDDRAGIAFSGPAGATLDRLLGSAGLSRGDLLLVPMVPWRPPGGRPVNEAEVALCLPFLHRILALARPSHLVLLGAGPWRALGDPAAGFRKARGRWAEVTPPGWDAPLAAMPMLAADLWLSSPTAKQSTWSDLLTIRQRLAIQT